MHSRALTPKQQTFLQELLRNGGNAAAAYRRAFSANYTASGVSAAASRLRRHPLIVQALAAADAATRHAMDEAVNRYQITAERVADELARLAAVLSRVPGDSNHPRHPRRRHPRSVRLGFSDYR